MELLEKAEEIKSKAAYIEKLNREKNEFSKECEELKDKLFASAHTDVLQAKKFCAATNKASLHKKVDSDTEYVLY
jgi:hypothetical protein